MKELTQEEALAKIFGRESLNVTERVWKHRYSKGSLTSNVVDRILEDNGYILFEPAKYMYNGK